MTVNQVKQVEEICNEVVKDNKEVFALESPLAQAKAIQGLRAVFDEVSCTLFALYLSTSFFTPHVYFVDVPRPCASGVNWHPS